MNNTENILYPSPKQEYKVLVRCFTYNHSKYIEETLNGFAIQKTNFPFVCLVMDDASTDGEQDVIRAWMNQECDMEQAETIDISTSTVIIVSHKSNHSCTFAFYLLKQNLFKDRNNKLKHIIPWRKRSKYEAICEGDDYWIDPLKLQRQVDFMDENLEYSLVFHNAIRKFEGVDKQFDVFNDFSATCDVTIEMLISSWIVPTASVLFRMEVYNDYPSWHSHVYSGDLTLSLIAGYKGKIKYLHSIMSIYRINANNSSSMTSAITRKEIGYVERQHILLYQLFDKYSNGEYSSILNVAIQRLYKEIRFKRNKSKSIIYAALAQPTLFISKLKDRIKIIR